MQYTADNSGRLGQDVNIDLRVPFFPGDFPITVEGRNAHSIRSLRYRRFDFQRMDSFVDLLARDKWHSRWFGHLTGPMYLNYPPVNGAP